MAFSPFNAKLQEKAIRQQMKTVNLVASGPSQTLDSTTEKLLQAFSSQDSQLRRSAARDLAHIGSEQVITELMSALNYENEDVCGWAAWTLAQIGSATVVAALFKALKHSASHTRIWAIWALGQIYNQAAVKGLILALSHPDAQVRWRAACALGKIISALPPHKRREEKTAAFILGLTNRLERSLQDPHHYVRGRVAVALGQIGATTAVSGLKELLNDSEFYVRWRAAEALGVIGSNSAVKALLSTLNHQDPDIRVAVVSALGQIRLPEAVTGLLQALKDTDLFVRGKAASALGEIADPSVISQLQQALEDREIYVRCRADEALQKIKNTTVNPESATTLHDLTNGTQSEQMALISLISQNFQSNNFPKILVTSFAEASEHILCKIRGPLIKHIISIGSPGTTPPQGFRQIQNRLRLEFDDIEAPNNDPEYVLATSEHINKLLNFLSLVTEWEGNLLIHCQAGISRSAAIALTVYAHVLGVGKEEEAYACLLAVRPQAKPNKWIVELADTALGRKGKLIKAVQS